MPPLLGGGWGSGPTGNAAQQPPPQAAPVTTAPCRPIPPGTRTAASPGQLSNAESEHSSRGKAPPSPRSRVPLLDLGAAPVPRAPRGWLWLSSPTQWSHHVAQRWSQGGPLGTNRAPEGPRSREKGGHLKSPGLAGDGAQAGSATCPPHDPHARSAEVLAPHPATWALTRGGLDAYVETSPGQSAAGGGGPGLGASQPAGPTGSGLGPRTGTTSSGTVPPTWLLEEWMLGPHEAGGRSPPLTRRAGWWAEPGAGSALMMI